MKRLKRGSGIAATLLYAVTITFMFIIMAKLINQFFYYIQIKQINKAMKNASIASMLQIDLSDTTTLEALSKSWYVQGETVKLLKPKPQMAYKAYERIFYDNIKHLLFNKDFNDIKQNSLKIFLLEPQYIDITNLTGYKLYELTPTGLNYKTTINSLTDLSIYLKNNYNISINLTKVNKIATNIEDSKKFRETTIISVMKDYKLKNILANQNVTIVDTTSVSYVRKKKQ